MWPSWEKLVCFGTVGGPDFRERVLKNLDVSICREVLGTADSGRCEGRAEPRPPRSVFFGGGLRQTEEVGECALAITKQHGEYYTMLYYTAESR